MVEAGGCCGSLCGERSINEHNKRSINEHKRSINEHKRNINEHKRSINDHHSLIWP